MSNIAEKMNKDVASGGVIAAAIVASLVGAGTAAATTLATLLTSFKVSCGGVIANGSPVALTLWQQGDPKAGVWRDQSKASIARMPSAQALFDAWKESGDAPEAAQKIESVEHLTSALIILWQVWLEQIFVRDNVVGTLGLSAGILGGVDGIALYHNPEKSIGVAFYLFNPLIGKPEAGCSVADYSTMKNWIQNDNASLSGIIDHIRTTRSADTRLSVGELQTVSLYDLEIKFAAGDIVEFNLARPVK